MQQLATLATRFSNSFSSSLTIPHFVVLRGLWISCYFAGFECSSRSGHEKSKIPIFGPHRSHRALNYPQHSALSNYADTDPGQPLRVGSSIEKRSTTNTAGVTRKDFFNQGFKRAPVFSILTKKTVIAKYDFKATLEVNKETKS